MNKMHKVKDPELFRLIKKFLGSYLLSIRQRSDNTADSYRYALNLYLVYVQEKHNKALSEVQCCDFSQENIHGFMEWLKNERNNECTTINQRLSHLRTFCEYLHKNGKIAYSDLNDIALISRIKDQRKQELICLSIEQTKLVLKQPDIMKKTGRRDRFFIALLYDSGCRDQEILNLKVKDFAITKNNDAEIRILGKGKKYRATPISSEVARLFREYCKDYHPDTKESQDRLLFYTVRNGLSAEMSADNVQRFMKVYEKSAQCVDRTLPHLHPHLFRHRRALHLYIAGVPLPLVAEWLGHSNLETTLIYYAQASLEMKRKAASKLADDDKSVFREDITFKYADDEEILKKLSGLK